MTTLNQYSPLPIPTAVSNSSSPFSILDDDLAHSTPDVIPLSGISIVNPSLPISKSVRSVGNWVRSDILGSNQNVVLNGDTDTVLIDNVIPCLGDRNLVANSMLNELELCDVPSRQQIATASNFPLLVPGHVHNPPTIVLNSTNIPVDSHDNAVKPLGILCLNHCRIMLEYSLRRNLALMLLMGLPCFHLLCFRRL